MTENITKNVSKISAMLKNKELILRLGFILTVCGFAVGYLSEQFIPDSIVQPIVSIAKMIFILGAILLCYYFMVFVSFTKSKTVENNNTQTSNNTIKVNGLPKFFAKCPICEKEEYYDFINNEYEYTCIHCKSKFNKTHAIVKNETPQKN